MSIPIQITQLLTNTNLDASTFICVHDRGRQYHKLLRYSRANKVAIKGWSRTDSQWPPFVCLFVFFRLLSCFNRFHFWVGCLSHVTLSGQLPPCNLVLKCLVCSCCSDLTKKAQSIVIIHPLKLKSFKENFHPKNNKNSGSPLSDSYFDMPVL